MDDLEPREVRDAALEPGVLGARDDQGIQIVLGHRGPRVRVAALELAAQPHQCASHDASIPRISAVIASLSGDGTPSSWPKREMPPFR